MFVLGLASGMPLALTGSTLSAWMVKEGVDIKTTTHQIKLQDSKLDVSYDFEAPGARLRSHMTGEWNGSVFQGRYETSVIDGDAIDAGTWSASRAK